MDKDANLLAQGAGALAGKFVADHAGDFLKLFIKKDGGMIDTQDHAMGSGTYKKGGKIPHNMIKHSSPLAMDEHGLFQHDLYNTVQQTGFGIKTYVKYE